MAPKKFGLFRGRSREQHEQPSTENLLQTSPSCTEAASTPSPIPSTSRGYHNDDHGLSEFAMMRVADSDDEDEDSEVAGLRRVALARAEETKNYRALPSTSGTSTTTLQDLHDLHDLQDLQNLQDLQELELLEQSQLGRIQKFELATPDDSTSIDVNSIQFDMSSLASEDVRYCGAGAAKKHKKKSRANQDLTDEEMWAVSDSQVIERLLKRNCSVNELIKWEAIALARGICTLTTNCVCRDCNPGVPPPALTDGDAGMASAPFLSAVSIGCQLQ